MSIEAITNVMSNALFLILKLSIPILLISLIIGLIISIFQTVTSIQEQTLTFVPKIVGVFLGIILLGDWLLTSMSNFMIELWSDFTNLIR